MPATSANPYRLLLAALVALLVLPALIGPALARPLALHAVTAVVLVMAIYTLSGERRQLWIALLLGVPSLVARLLALVLESRPLQTTAGCLAVLFLAFTAAVILRDVLRRGRVGEAKITGAVCVYLLLGLVWGLLFGLLHTLEPGSLSLPVEADARQTQSLGIEPTFVYFSFVTLTTLGYGDVLPVTPRAQTLAWTEAVVGQLFLAILIGRLVGLAVSRETGESPR